MAKRQSYRNNKRDGKVLLTILAILFFPITITVLIVKSSLSTKVKAILLSLMWIGIPVVSFVTDFFTPDIKGITHSDNSPIAIVAGKDGITETIIVETTKDDVVTDDSVLIIIDDPSIAEVTERSNSKNGEITYKVVGLKAGTTYIHAETAKGKYPSENREIVVRDSIPVKTVAISDPVTTIPIGETIQLHSTAEPSNADIENIYWTSSDQNVMTVDKDGIVTASGKGTATITAFINDVSSSIDIMVDTSKRLMEFYPSYEQVNDNYIGADWYQIYEVNGENASRYSKYTLNVGDKLQLWVKMYEDDDNPDIGTSTVYHTVTEDDLLEGFEVKTDVYVTENGGQNRGLSVHYVVTFAFKPA